MRGEQHKAKSHRAGKSTTRSLLALSFPWFQLEVPARANTMSANQAPPKQPTQRKLIKKGLFAKDCAPVLFPPARDMTQADSELCFSGTNDVRLWRRDTGSRLDRVDGRTRHRPHHRHCAVRIPSLALGTETLTRPAHVLQCVQAHRVSTNRGKIKVDDFRFALRNDPKKLARLDELLFMQEEIARARRGFDNSFNDYANDEDLAAARADVAAGITTLGGPSSAANGPQNGGGSGATGFGKKPTLSANASAAGGLALPGGGSSSKGKGKAAAAASAAP